MNNQEHSFFDEITVTQGKLCKDENDRMDKQRKDAREKFDKEVKALTELTQNEIRKNGSKKVILFNIPLDFCRDARWNVLNYIMDGFKGKANVYACKYGPKSENNFVYRRIDPPLKEYPKIWPNDTTDASLFAIEFNASPNKVLKNEDGLLDLSDITPYV